MRYAITDLGLHDVLVDGVRSSHRDIMEACVQDDPFLASSYRDIAEQIFPLLKEKEAEAYRTHAATAPPTRLSLLKGHGSFASGPDVATQGAWLRWSRLVTDYSAAIRGDYRPIPASRDPG